MKYTTLLAICFALLAVSVLAQGEEPLTPAVPAIEPTAPGVIDPASPSVVEPLEPTAPAVVPTAAPIAPIAPITPTPEATLTPSTGTIYFSVFTADNCPTTATFFSATVRDDYAACQTISVGGSPQYVKMGCYSNNTLIGAAYSDSACTTQFLSFPLVASGTCATLPTGTPEPAKTFRGFCPDDAGNPANIPAPQLIPTTPSAASPLAFSGLLVVVAVLSVFFL